MAISIVVLHCRRVEHEKIWRSEEERELGHFTLKGLAGLMDETFDPLPSSETAAPRSEDVVIFAI